MQPELLTHYKDVVAPALREKLSCANVHEVPRIEKVVIQSSVGSQTDRKQALQDVTEEIAKITGQKPISILSKRSVSNFKLRAGEPIAAKVTLRGNQMYEFLQRFLKTAVPRIRDFRGVSPKSFDGRGNYSMGISDQTIFPEIELDKVKRNIGFDVTIITSARDNDSAHALLAEMGMPFRKPKVEDPNQQAEQEQRAEALKEAEKLEKAKESKADEPKGQGEQGGEVAEAASEEASAETAEA